MSSAGKPTTRLDGPRDEWEYHVVHWDVDTFFFGPEIHPDVLRDLLNAAGSDGWELVNTVDINRGNGRTTELMFLFKRRYRPDRYVHP